MPLKERWVNKRIKSWFFCELPTRSHICLYDYNLFPTLTMCLLLYPGNKLPASIKNLNLNQCVVIGSTYLWYSHFVTIDKNVTCLFFSNLNGFHWHGQKKFCCSFVLPLLIQSFVFFTSEPLLRIDKRWCKYWWHKIMWKCKYFEWKGNFAIVQMFSTSTMEGPFRHNIWSRYNGQRWFSLWDQSVFVV